MNLKEFFTEEPHLKYGLKVHAPNDEDYIVIQDIVDCKYALKVNLQFGTVVRKTRAPDGLTIITLQILFGTDLSKYVIDSGETLEDIIKPEQILPFGTQFMINRTTYTFIRLDTIDEMHLETGLLNTESNRIEAKLVPHRARPNGVTQDNADQLLEQIGRSLASVELIEIPNKVN